MKRMYPGTLGRPSQGSRGKNSGKVVEREFFPLKQLQGRRIDPFYHKFLATFFIFFNRLLFTSASGHQNPQRNNLGGVMMTLKKFR